MASVSVKLQRRGQMVIPRVLRDEAGIADGTVLSISVIDGGRFLLTPQSTARWSVPGRASKATGGKIDAQARRKLASVVAELRHESTEKGLDLMPVAEIKRAVAAARRDAKKKIKHSA